MQGRAITRCNLKPMSLRIVVEMISAEETMDEEGLWGDLNLSKLVCYYCGKPGHQKSEC